MNLLNPSDCFTHHQISYKKILHDAHIGYMCCVRSHNKQRLLPYTTLADWFCITEVDSVYSAVRTEYLYKTDTLIL